MIGQRQGAETAAASEGERQEKLIGQPSSHRCRGILIACEVLDCISNDRFLGPASFAVGNNEFSHLLPVRSHKHGVAWACAVRDVLDGDVSIAAQVLLQGGDFSRSDPAFQVSAEDSGPDGLQLPAFEEFVGLQC